MKREAPCTGCTDRYDQVADLLQRGEKQEARQAAIQIDCDHVRTQALVLIERSRHLQAYAPA